MTALLVGIGLQEDDAHRLVEDELFFEPTMNIPLSQLLYGRKVGKSWQTPTTIESAAATKLLKFMQAGEGEALTDKERAAPTIVTTNKVTMKSDGFLERAAGYCKSDDVLHKLLTLVIKPVLTQHGAKITVSEG